MADGTLSGSGQWPEEQKPKLDTGEGETPLTTPPKIDVRTMASDKKSLEEGGGVQPRPYIPPPNTPTISPAQLTDKPKSEPMLQEQAKDVFKPPQIESTQQTPAAMPMDLIKKSKPKKGLINFLIALIALAGLGALSYFVIYPTFFQEPQVVVSAVCGNGTCEADENATNCSADCQTAPPTPPICGDGVCEGDETSNNCALDCQTPTPPPPSTSLFKIPADTTISLTTGLELASMKEKIKNTLPNTPPPLLVEYVLPDTEPLTQEQLNNSTVHLEGLLGIARLSQEEKDRLIAEGKSLPKEQLPDSLKTAFSQEEFTLFAYMDKNENVWFGTIFKINMNQPEYAKDMTMRIEEIKNTFAQEFENQKELDRLIMNGMPGNQQTWKTSQTGNRYLTFSSSLPPGFAINYGWFDNKLIVTNHYDAFKEAVRRLQ